MEHIEILQWWYAGITVLFCYHTDTAWFYQYRGLLMPEINGGDTWI